MKKSYYLPPEWSTQSGMMLTWPHQRTIWSDMLDKIDKVYVEVVSHVARYQKVMITCFDMAHQNHIIRLLQSAKVFLDNVHLYLVPSDDIWVRDHGPISVFYDGKPMLLDFTFNGWGGKYPATQDNKITRALHEIKGFGETPLETLDMILEGGAIEVDGKGTLLTTQRCLLSKTRNPSLTQTDMSDCLKTLFGVNRIIWLQHGGLEGDDTDGHIDTLVRFVNPHTLCYVHCDDPHDEHFTRLQMMEEELRELVDYQGNPYQLVSLPWPRAHFADVDGRRLPATYANFLIINDAVLVPTYDDPADSEALRIFALLFPDRKIIGIHSVPVIQWYGSLHCMTMQLISGVLS